MLKRLAVVVTVLSVVAAGCGGGDDTLTVYSGRTENLIGPLLADFADRSGISVEVRYGSSADLALLVSEEGDRSPADVFISQSPGAIGFLAGEDRLQPLSEEVLNLVAPEFRSGAGLWVGMSGRVRVIVYNKDLIALSDLPSSIFDLTAPQYRDQVGLAPTNGSFQDFVTAMREVNGDETTARWLSDMENNGARTYTNNTAIVQAVGRGEVPMGLVNHYYNFRALAEDPSLPTENYFFGNRDVGSLLIATAIGVLDTAGDRDLAGRLVAFMLSAEAQRFFSEETSEYPLAAGVAPGAELPDLATLGVATYDFDSLGGGLERTKQLIEDSGLESP